MNTETREDANTVESVQALILPTEKDKLDFVKRELLSISVMRKDNGTGISLNIMRHIKSAVFICPHLNTYKDDLVKRLEQLTAESGFERIRELESVNFDYIRKNAEFCAKWAAIAIEARGLVTISYNGGRLDDFGLTNRILTEEDNSVFFLA